jgi:hypothetical protein
MKKSRLLPQALCFLSLFLILGVQGYAQTCEDMTPGVGGSLNGFLPFSGTTATLYGPSAWNYNISAAAVDPNSAAIISEISGNNTSTGTPSKLHPDFGPSGGMPYTIVDSSVQPFISIPGLVAGPASPESEASQSDAVVEPAPITAPIEGQQPDCLDWPQSEYYFGDTHMLIIDRNQCFLYETYLTSRCDGQFSAGGQALWDLGFGEVRPYGWTSTDAAGLPVWPGLVKYDEAATGTINHAFRMTVARTKGDNDGGYFVFPAGHGASQDYRWKYLNPLGMRLQLIPSTDITSFSTINQTILTAMENYGLILADNGSNMFVTGTTDSRWDTGDLGNWHGGGSVDCANETYAGEPCYLTSKDFQVIQMSPEDFNLQDEDSYGIGDPRTYSYMDANSAPYTVNDVQQLGYPGGTGPEGTTLSGYGGEDPNNGSETSTGGITVPVINSFEAQYTIFGIPIGSNLCGTQISVDPGSAVAFTTNITGSTYQYIDNAGPFRVDGAGDGIRYTTNTNTQTYTEYAMNSSGMTTSAACVLYVGEAILPTPVLSPTTGTYNTVIYVQISDPGYPGATIFYTTDESQPTEVAGNPLGTTQIYTGPITITSTTPDPVTYLPGEQINAIAVDSLFTNPSAVGSAVYVVNGQAPPPVITPVSGTYDLGQTITITPDPLFEPIDVNQDQDPVWIYYTTDGSTPSGDAYGDANGTSIACAVGIYGNGPCTFQLAGGPTTVNAVDIAVGYTLSTVATASYNVVVDYTLVVTPSVVTTQIGSTAASASVTVTSVNGYSGTISFTCAGLPSGDTCVFSPASLSISPGYPGVAVITFSQVSAHNNSNPLFPGGATLAVALCFFGLRKRRRLQMLLLLAVSVIGLGLFTGCGTPGTIPVDATVVVTGTDGNGLSVSGSFLLIENLPGQI